MNPAHSNTPRVAIALEMEWGYKRHMKTYAGCLNYASEARWDCVITPSSNHIFKSKKDEKPFDGVIARATKPMATTAGRKKVPLVNVWLNSPATQVPSVHADFEESGRIAAEHLMSRGFRRFGYLGYVREIESKRQIKGFKNTLQLEDFRCSIHQFARTSLHGNANAWDEFRSGLLKWVASWRPPIGIFVVNDLYCRYLMDACRSVGLHVPHDYAIIGTANEPVFATPPTLH